MMEQKENLENFAETKCDHVLSYCCYAVIFCECLCVCLREYDDSTRLQKLTIWQWVRTCVALLIRRTLLNGKTFF